MKIEYVRFAEPIRIISHVTNAEHTYLNFERYELDLIDYSYLEIRAKGNPQLVAIVPFSRCNYVRPSNQSLTDLDDLTDLEDSSDSELLDVPRRGRPKLNGSYKATTA